MTQTDPVSPRTASARPPQARRAVGDDPYAWLQERDSAEVLDYLKAENAWQEAALLAEQGLREQLFEEIKARIRETDLSLPSPWGPYLYYTRTTAGDEYARHYRCPRPADGSLLIDDSAEQLLLDPNVLAAGGFLSLGTFSVSPDHQRLAYSLDTNGEEIYRLYVKELGDESLRELPFDDCDGSMTWANDSQTLFFAELDDTHRPYKLYRHTHGRGSLRGKRRAFLPALLSRQLRTPADPATGQQNHQRKLGARCRPAAAGLSMRCTARGRPRLPRRPWPAPWPVGMVHTQQPGRHQLCVVPGA
jgi:protease II